jgi:D-3-phosphoglycerate dehydrogenase
MENVILTPHIGGSTEEAQLDIAQYVAARLADYLADGATIGSVNLPEIAAPRPTGTHRIAHLHENVPGRLAAIDRVLAEHGLNIAGQHLGTTGAVGYALTDVEGSLNEEVIANLAAIPHTLRTRPIEPLA